jgi:hypothetical protein
MYIDERIKIKTPAKESSAPLKGKRSNRKVSPNAEIIGAKRSPEQAAHPAPKKPKNIPRIDEKKVFPFKIFFCLL